MPRSRATSTRRAERAPVAPAPALLLVGGKGGVGKTTCAAALALASARDGLRTLLISTDPAPSLADALRVPLGGSARRVRPGLPLDAVELDAPRAFRRWLKTRRNALQQIAAHGTLLDDSDLAALLDLSLPGIDEVAALLEIAAFVRDGRYDRIVADTAPTGHTLRLLAMPDALARLAAVFDAMQAKHRAMVAALRGSWEADAGDALVADLANSAETLHALLRDPDRTGAWWVTHAERLAAAETLDGVEALRASGIGVAAIVVNRLTDPPPGRCERCEIRRGVEAGVVRDLAKRFDGIPVRFVAGRPAEPRGVAALLRIAREIQGGRPPAPAPRRAAPRGTWRARLDGQRSRPATLAGPSVRLVLFGGKGGVGKTTSAAAAALALAERRRILLVSTDPAHSVGDALGVPAADDARSVPGTRGRLRIREIDAPARFDAVRQQYRSAVDALFARLTGGGPIDAAHDRRVLSALVELAPPGLDEIVAVADVADLLAAPGVADVIVLDLAPSGHALRLLETPGLVHDWVRALMGILLKYRALVGLGGLAEMLLDLSKRLGALRELLRDRERAVFVDVTRAASLPRLETARTLARIARMQIPLGAVLVNAVGRGTCARCRREAAAEATQLRAIARLVRAARVPVVVTAEAAPPPSGAAALRAWGRTWRVYDRA